MKMMTILFFTSLVIFSYAIKLRKEYSDKIYIFSKVNDLCLVTKDDFMYAHINTARCEGYNSEWKLKFNSEDGTFYIFEKNNNSPKNSIDIDGISFFTIFDFQSVKFYIDETTDKNYYKIRNKDTNRCLQYQDTYFKLADCNEEKNLFYFQSPLGKEYFPKGEKNLPAPINDPVPAPINDPVPAPINDPVPAPINDPVPAPDAVPSPIVTSPDPLQASKPKSCVRSYFSFLPRTQYETYQPNYFNGIWYVDGLFCDNQFVSTSVEIKNFTAITLEQNPCYSQGSILFTDKVSPTVIRSNHNIAVTYYLENNEKSRVWLSVTGKNTFVISKYNLTFYRKLD